MLSIHMTKIKQITVLNINVDFIYKIVVAVERCKVPNRAR